MYYKCYPDENMSWYIEPVNIWNKRELKWTFFSGLLSIKYHTIRMLLKQTEISTKNFHTYVGRTSTDAVT